MTKEFPAKSLSAGTARARKDLRVEPLSVASRVDWADPERALVQLYRSAESGALRTVEWYLADKKSKRRMSRMLRGSAILIAAIGSVYPLVVTSQSLSWSQTWGYVLLALAATFIAFDRFFGLSSAWMRDMSSANGINTRLLRFQHDWTALLAGTDDGAADVSRLVLLRTFVEDVADEVNRESAAWRQEFCAQITEFDNRVTEPAPSSRQQNDNYMSMLFTERHLEAGIDASIGAFEDAHDVSRRRIPSNDARRS